MFAFVLTFLLAESQNYSKSVNSLWDLTSKYTTQKIVSWGVNYEGIYNKERLWVKENLKIDFYDISEETDTPSMSKFYNLQTTCKNSVTFLLRGNKFMSIHGQDQYCTCAWSPANPCPHKLQITGSGIDYAGKYQFYTNTVLAVDSLDDVVGTYGMAQPFEGCTNITNPEEIDGKWCVVYRGACFFQTKWENCHAAGAIGTILVVLDDSTGAGWSIWVESISSPLVGITNSLGEDLRKTWEGGKKDVILSLGKGIGVDAPDADYSEPEPLRTMNYYTGELTEDDASHFQTVQSLIYNEKSDYVHFTGVDGVGSDIQVYDMDQSPPIYKGNYTIGVDGTYGFIYNEPNSGKPPVVMYATDAWDGRVTFYDMQDELNPVYIGELFYEPCDEDDFHGLTVLHPSQRYMYLVPSIHLGGCPYTIRLYDISSLTDITKITEIHIPEVDDNADIYSFNFGLNNIAALSLSSAGVSWYDFTDPANPVPVAHFDLSQVQDTYTLGVRGTRQLSDGDTWVIEDETEFWYNFHAVKLVDNPAAAVEPGAAAVGPAAKSCDDDSDTWMAVAIIFLVLTVLSCLAAVLFFYKWNMEVNFKFHQMGEYVEETNKNRSTYKDEDP